MKPDRMRVNRHRTDTRSPVRQSSQLIKERLLHKPGGAFPVPQHHRAPEIRSEQSHLLELELEQMRLEHRLEFATRLLNFAGFWIASALGIVIASGLSVLDDLFGLPNALLITLVCMTSVSTLGVATIAARTMRDRKK
ncbi:MAG: hypothetical protein AAF662_01815 [Pseudomonadota bacterium]